MDTPPSAPSRTSGFAITSLVLGIVSLLGAALLLVPSILAVVFGHLSLSQCKKDPGLGGKGMGIAGLTMGYVSLAFGFLFTLGFCAAIATPAFQKVRERSQEKAIYNNMRQLSAAADQYYIEKGQTMTRFEDLVGPGKYLPHLREVNGETYPTVFKQGAPVEVHLQNGKVLTYEP